MTPSTTGADFVGYDDGFYSGDSNGGFGMSSAGSGGGGYYTTSEAQGQGSWTTSHGGGAFVGSNTGNGHGEVFYTTYDGQDVRTTRG